MLGQEPGWFWKITWAFVCPIFLLAIIIISLIERTDPKCDFTHYYSSKCITYGVILTGTMESFHTLIGPTPSAGFWWPYPQCKYLYGPS